MPTCVFKCVHKFLSYIIAVILYVSCLFFLTQLVFICSFLLKFNDLLLRNYIGRTLCKISVIEQL